MSDLWARALHRISPRDENRTVCGENVDTVMWTEDWLDIFTTDEPKCSRCLSASRARIHQEFDRECAEARRVYANRKESE
jgi:hypothetical protein